MGRPPTPPADSPEPHPDLTHFLSLPWTSALLLSPTTTILPPIRSREPKESTEDQLFADTFRTPHTIYAALSHHPTQPPQPLLIPRITTLFSLGLRLNGYAGVLHGGIIATLLDEAMGIYLSRNQERGAFSADGSPTMGGDGESDVFTGELKVRFLKPVVTPGAVAVEVALEKVQGRKYFVSAVMRDGEGNKVAKGEAVWIVMRPVRKGVL